MKYRIRNWGHFQHYKDRNPPWIKLHFELLSSSDWVMLADASRVVAIACMLVGSRNAGEIDGSPTGLAYLRRVAYLDKTPNLKPLIDCGFLEQANDSLADASGCLQGLANARPETETETETEAEDQEHAPSASHSTPAITIPLNTGEEFPVTQAQSAEFAELYPAVDVAQALRAARAWCITNPAKRKTRGGVLRFLNTWLAREQDRGGNVRSLPLGNGPPAHGKTMGAILELERMKHDGNMAEKRIPDRLPEAGHARIGRAAGG